jgi:uncharacterized protein (TIGR02680 family)
MSHDSAPSASSSALPAPKRERFQPLRCGLINLYRYDDQEFRFEQGRLLVRGNNGTGKSRVLALTLPFLLDGEIDPRRVEPDRDPAKRMEWNLLLNQHTDRSGYTWIEFGRRVIEDGVEREEFVTLGCGLRAIKDHGAPERWFFVTDLRLGRDFQLVSAEPPLRPLNREQLQQALGERGKIFKKPDDYRLEVDARLFRLKTRYASLLQLLIQLRQPQLARELKEDTLSRALGEALAPLDDHLLDDVAEAFRALETERGEMINFTAARDAVSTFLGDYSAYLRCAARRRAAALRKANRIYEDAQRELRTKEAEVASLRTAALDCEQAVATRHRAYITAKAELDTLEDDDAVRSLRGLQDARKAAADAAERSRVSGSIALQAREGESLSQQSLDEKRAHTLRSRADFEERLEETRQLALAAGLAPEHAARWTPPVPPEWTDTEKKSRHAHHEKALANRAAAFAALSKKITARDDAQLALDAAARRCAELEAASALATETLASTRAQLRTLATEALAALRAWAASLRELPFSALDDQEDALERWCDQAQGEAPWMPPLRESERTAHKRIADARAALDQRRQDLAARRATLVEEQTQLQNGRHQPPPPPYVRAASRDARPGAPLWRVVDFHDNVPSADQAGLEAALESSGLLDAWLTPDGHALKIGLHDTWLDAAALPPLPPEKSLARWLRPVAADEPHFPPSPTIARVLAVIASDASSDAFARVSSDGGWRLGPLAGTWAKPRAEHIGELRREAARLHRLDQIAAELSTLTAAEHALAAEHNTLAQREHILRAEVLAVPSDQPMRDLGARLLTQTDVLQQIQRDRPHADQARIDREQKRDDAHRALVADAHDLRLPDCLDTARLQACRDATSSYREIHAGLVPLGEAWIRAVAEESSSDIAHDQIAAQAARLSETAFADEEEATRTQATCAALEASLGMDETELLEKVRLTELAAKQTHAAWETAKSAQQSNTTQLQVSRSQEEALGKLHAQRDAERWAVVPPLRRLVEHDLLREADERFSTVEAGDWNITAAVRLARDIDEALRADTSLEDADWTRHLNDFRGQFQELQDKLQAHGYRGTYQQPDEGVYVVTAAFQNKPCSMRELHAGLAAELAARGALLDNKEREVIENHLLGEVASQLQERIRRAEKDVSDMNKELHDRPNSTGMRLRFVWEPKPDGPPGLDAARAQLRRTTELWTPQERTDLAAFLQRRIQDVKAQLPPGTAWKEQLALALDYRDWHRFSIEREQDGQWKRLTKRIYGTGSGGEKALMLTLPQVAAAAAHYRSAAPEAPRLILLDEVFVGIDNDARAKCLGLLAAFDLDVVMTSEREWGTYPTVPGLAIYQLATRPGIDAIGVTRWVWNGRELDSEDLAAS